MLHPTPKLGDVVKYQPVGVDAKGAPLAEVDAKIVKVFHAEAVGLEWSDATKRSDDGPIKRVTQPVTMGDGQGRWHWPLVAPQPQRK